MPPPPHQKPENVLKRANELIGVNQAPAALTLLHEHVASKRSRNVPIASLEPVMLLLVEQSVEQKKGKLAKDALYQYKNIAQNSNIATIELVLKDFLEKAAAKVTEAQKKADEVQSSLEASQAAQASSTSGGTANIDDLEASETPESILLATVSGEQSRDRTDRAIVTPWLKFLWEAYRTVLDILRNNARLELFYHSTAMQAFDFCLKYTRKTEFRRLCELLRNHVQTAAKYSSQMHAINLSDPDTLQRHLETRFQQLNVAVELELWQEAFRSVEDIHTLLSLSKRPPKAIMMANYYEKLTRIFLVGENYLFHAAAWSRYYNLLRQSAALVASGQAKKADSPSTTEADQTRAASFVLLSALAIPVISTSRSRGAMIDFDEAKKNKNSRLTHLLGMNTAPTRVGLFRDAMSKAILRHARPEIRELYNILEVDFHPLSICKKISPILTKIGEDAEMAKYILPLQQVILTRLFQQLSQVYETVDLSFVSSLAQFPEPYQVSRATVEKFIMNGNKKGDLAIRMDHATGVLTFDTDIFSSAKAVHSGSAAGSAEADGGAVQHLQSTPSEIVRSQLSRLAKSLYTTCYYVDPSFNEQRILARNAALARAKAGAEQEHLDTLARKEIIQKRREEVSELQAKREKENAKIKRLREQAQQEAEQARQLQEQKEREARRIEREREQIRQTEVENMIKELKIGPKALDIDSENLSTLDPQKLRAIKLAQLEREKNDINEKLRVTGKRIDHLERAYRKEEVKKLATDYSEQQVRDKAAYEKVKTETLANAEATHKANVELKHRLSRLVEPFETFRDEIIDRRRDEFDRRRREAERELEKQINLRKKEYRERKLREKRAKEEEEQRLREAEERAAREKEEQKKREEARKEEMARFKEQREREREQAAELVALQQRREEEALEAAARRKAEKQAGPSSSSSGAPPFRRGGGASNDLPSETSSSERRPALNLPGAGKWREREAAKGAASSSSSNAPPSSSSARGRDSDAPAPRTFSGRGPAMERTDSNDRPAGSRPVLNLPGAGNWRERLAAKEAAAASGGGSASGSAAASSRSRERDSADTPPPRSFSGRGPPMARTGSARGAPGSDRDASPAPKLAPSGAPGKYVPRHLRGNN